MTTMTRADTALTLRRALDAGALFTLLAEGMCGQPVHADIERLNPPLLFTSETGPGLLDMTPGESWAALRRHGQLVQSDGTPVARVSSVVAAGRIPDETCRTLTRTCVPLGKALGPHVRREVLWSSLAVNEYAVHCGARLWAPVPGRGMLPVAVAAEWVLRAWLDSLGLDAPVSLS